MHEKNERVSSMDSIHEPEVQSLLCMGIPAWVLL